MSKSQHRFFIALLPSVAVQQYANQVKHNFVEVYNSCAAQKSPPLELATFLPTLLYRFYNTIWSAFG